MESDIRALYCGAERALNQVGRTLDMLAAILSEGERTGTEFSRALRTAMSPRKSGARAMLEEIARQLQETLEKAERSAAETTHSCSDILARVVPKFPGDSDQAPGHIDLCMAPAPGETSKEAAVGPSAVEVADKVFVSAIVLPESCQTYEEALGAIRSPALHYIPSWNHFAIRMGNALVHGNVGNIYTAREKRPQGVKPCRNVARSGNCSDPDCTYYHDPLTTGAARIPAPLCVRSYFSDSFSYSPRMKSPGQGSARYGTRRFGAAQSLAIDLDLITDAEAWRFLDQVAHDLVCAAVLLTARPHLSGPRR